MLELKVTQKYDIAEAIRTQLKTLNHFDKNSIRSIKVAYLGTAVVSLPALDAGTLLDAH